MLMSQYGNSCPAKVQCYKDVYAMDYEEPMEEFSEEDWNGWLDEISEDQI